MEISERIAAIANRVVMDDSPGAPFAIHTDLAKLSRDVGVMEFRLKALDELLPVFGQRFTVGMDYRPRIDWVRKAYGITLHEAKVIVDNWGEDE